MARRNSLNSLSDEDLLKFVEDRKKYTAEKTNITDFISQFNLKSGNKFYTNKFLYYLYCSTTKEHQLNRYLFCKLLKIYFSYKRKKTSRGFLLANINETPMDLYKSLLFYEKEKTTRRIPEA